MAGEKARGVPVKCGFGGAECSNTQGQTVLACCFFYRNSRTAHQTISRAMTLLTTAAYRENSTRSREPNPA